MQLFVVVIVVIALFIIVSYLVLTPMNPTNDILCHRKTLMCPSRFHLYNNTAGIRMSNYKFYFII